MPRLIDANKTCRIIEQLFCGNCRSYTHCEGCPQNDVLKILRNQPTVDAEPKHAYVIVDEDGNMECSNCGSSFCFDSYCGHCGAKLIGERKKEVDEKEYD